MKIFLIVFALCVLWSLWGYFSSRVEQTDYEVLKKADGYEIRNYPKHIVAQTTVEGSNSDALNQGFRIVAGYIFGGNLKKESIAMTTPVTEQKMGSEKIAMTAPVLASVEGNSKVISFSMPRTYTLATLPVPTDSRVKLVEVPAQKVAVRTFSWFRTDARVKSKEQELLSLLSRDAITTVGESMYAGYSAPWTPPWMTRNEILVKIN